MTQIKPIVSIKNIVASASIDQKEDLIEISENFSDTEYNPEQFPGLIHRMLDPKIVILLFASGKSVCTEVKKESDVYRSVHNLHSLLEEKSLMIYNE